MRRGGSQPIFIVVTAPRVMTTKREDLVEWLQLRNEYEENIRQRCKDGKKTSARS